MEGVLPLVYYNHIKKLVTACYLLKKHSISNHDLKESEQLIQQFHLDFMVLYG